MTEGEAINLASGNPNGLSGWVSWCVIGNDHRGKRAVKRIKKAHYLDFSSKHGKAGSVKCQRKVELCLRLEPQRAATNATLPLCAVCVKLLGNDLYRAAREAGEVDQFHAKG